MQSGLAYAYWFSAHVAYHINSPLQLHFSTICAAGCVCVRARVHAAVLAFADAFGRLDNQSAHTKNAFLRRGEPSHRIKWHFNCGMHFWCN